MPLDQSDPNSYEVVYIPSSVLCSRDLKPADKVVYAAISDALQRGIRPTLEELARSVNMCTATVNEATKRLAGAGFLRRKALPGSGGLVLEIVPEGGGR